MFKIIIKSIIYCLFTFYLFFSSAWANIIPSSEDLRNYPFTPLGVAQGMVFANVVATIKVDSANSPIYSCQGNVCRFVQIPRCPAGSIYYNPTATFDGNQVYQCWQNNSCNYNDTTQIGIKKTGSGLTFGIMCTLNLQGWFPATFIKTLLIKNGNTQSAAPTNNFNLGTYAITLTCGANRYCQCVGSPGTTIPSYGNLCDIALGIDDIQTFPNAP